METSTRARSALSDYIADLWERDTLGYLDMNLQNNPSYRFATHEQDKYCQVG